jgi:hypothetical protein
MRIVWCKNYEKSAVYATPQPDPQVAAELESAQARNAVLEDVNANVGQRLDDAIERIKTILEV